MRFYSVGAGTQKKETTGENEGVAINHDSQFPIIKGRGRTDAEHYGARSRYGRMGRYADAAGLSRKTGIKLTYTTPPSADFSTKLNLAFASGDLPDIVYGAGSNSLTSSMEIDYGSQGILLPLEEYITPEIMPNLYALTQEDPSILKSITTPDGHIYSLPMISRNATSIWWQGPMWYNGTWLDKLDVKELPKDNG